jgi:hypothetical protein
MTEALSVMSFSSGSRLSLSGTATREVEPLKTYFEPVWSTSVGLPLLLLPDESIICPSVSLICQSAAFSSSVHAAGEAIEAVNMAATTTNTQTPAFSLPAYLP